MSTLHRLLQRDNPVKEKLLRGESSLGLFILSASPIVMETCSTLPLDWLLVDCEASPVTPERVLHLFQAVAGSNVVPLVRVPSPAHHNIEHMLDLGAYGILVAKVESAAMAKAVVDATFFPPMGRRGINPVRASGYFTDVPGYLASANQRTLCLVQIETRAGLDAVMDIAAVPGIDGLFIGPGDLAAALGQPCEVTGPRMDEARRKVLAACAAHSKIAAIFAYSAELARAYLDEGFLFISTGNDLKLLRAGFTAEIQAVNNSQ
jgi:2-keto-3-deoxy-L-rhamnonate aldolase RhmA